MFEIHLHLVWTTKYRKPVLTGKVALRLRELIREVCGQHEVKIMKGHVSKNHVHLFVSIPPQVTISQWCNAKEQDSELDDERVYASAQGVLGAAPVARGFSAAVRVT